MPGWNFSESRLEKKAQKFYNTLNVKEVMNYLGMHPSFLEFSKPFSGYSNNDPYLAYKTTIYGVLYNKNVWLDVNNLRT